MKIRLIACSVLALAGTAVIAAPAPVLDVNTGGVDERIERLERMVQTRTNVQHRLQQQLDSLQEEVSQLRGTLEKHTYQLENILQRQRELYLEIDKRISAISSQPPPAASTTSSNGSSDGSGSSMDENAAYDRAVDLILKDKRYEEAIPEFRSFLKAFPDSVFAANAHYWLGQLLFNKQDWSGASQHFEALVNNYSDSPKRADAMFKLGVVEQKRGNDARAKQLFEKVIAEYPDTSSKKLAESRLRDLR